MNKTIKNTAYGFVPCSHLNLLECGPDIYKYDIKGLCEAAFWERIGKQNLSCPCKDENHKPYSAFYLEKKTDMPQAQIKVNYKKDPCTKYSSLSIYLNALDFTDQEKLHNLIACNKLNLGCKDATFSYQKVQGLCETAFWDRIGKQNLSCHCKKDDHNPSFAVPLPKEIDKPQAQLRVHYTKKTCTKNSNTSIYPKALNPEDMKKLHSLIACNELHNLLIACNELALNCEEAIFSYKNVQGLCNAAFWDRIGKQNLSCPCKDKNHNPTSVYSLEKYIEKPQAQFRVSYSKKNCAKTSFQDIYPKALDSTDQKKLHGYISCNDLDLGCKDIIFTFGEIEGSLCKEAFRSRAFAPF